MNRQTISKFWRVGLISLAFALPAGCGANYGYTNTAASSGAGGSTMSPTMSKPSSSKSGSYLAPPMDSSASYASPMSETYATETASFVPAPGDLF